MIERRDILGRRIGRNWWREYILDCYYNAEDAWQALKGTNHQMEDDEFLETHPRPTLKRMLVASAGMSRIAT